ncbi:hypothetical protein Tco_0698842 [Tanacetum coccineum]
MNPDPDDVTFEFNQLQLSPEVDDDVTFGFNQAYANDDSKSVELTPKNDDVDDEEADVEGKGDDVDKEIDDVEDEEFTFTCLTEKTVISLFDQSLLYNNFNNNNEDGKRTTTSSSSTTATTLTAITDSNEINIKSNSTGFSNLQRCRDNNNNNDNNNINRSKSDGRDAFGFLNRKTREKKEVVKKKVEKPTVSALEEYLRRGEEEKRKSYLPYSHIRRRPAQPRPYGMTGVLYASIKKSLRVASNILPS